MRRHAVATGALALSASLLASNIPSRLAVAAPLPAGQIDQKALDEMTRDVQHFAVVLHPV